MSNRVTDPDRQGRQNTYMRYMQADFNRPDTYPTTAQLDAEHYRPLATWMGRLILPAPDQRTEVLGTLFEVYHADVDHQHLVGQVVRLRWMNDAETNQRFYGIIGGPGGEPARRSPVQWGHFSFGVAQVIHEPLADELIFDIDYQQVYVHSVHGLIAGTHHWSRYTGDRQFGWLGTRPIQDLLIKLDCFTSDFVNSELRRSALTETVFQLEAMTARYRIADGRGGTQISASNNCAQDSCQALYAAIKHIDLTLHERADIQEWMLRDPQQAQRLHRLLHLGRDLKQKMLPLGAARADWDWSMTTLGSSLAESPLRSLGMALRTWRTMLPSVAVRCIAEVFLDHGATAWVLRTNQVGGYDPRLKPIVPNV